MPPSLPAPRAMFFFEHHSARHLSATSSLHHLLRTSPLQLLAGPCHTLRELTGARPSMSHHTGPALGPGSVVKVRPGAQPLQGFWIRGSSSPVAGQILSQSSLLSDILRRDCFLPPGAAHMPSRNEDLIPSHWECPWDGLCQPGPPHPRSCPLPGVACSQCLTGVGV